MSDADFFVGEYVFVFSENLNEIIEGTIEGFNEGRTRVKVLQYTPSGLLRHVVSWVYVFRDRNSAEIAANEYRNMQYSYTDYQVGMTVYLRQSGELLRDSEGYPYVYQIVKVYQNKQKVSLVNSYGESIGTFPTRDIEFCSNDPIFKSSDYHVGQVVTWLETDYVYEGIITKLRDTTAEISNIKKLMPLDQKKNLPYYKIQSDGLYNNIVLTSIVGDDIDSE